MKKLPIQLGRFRRQHGSAMIEFAVVGPLITLLGTTVLQYALMFNAKNMVNHAGFMAAREGAVANADLASVQQAYARALVPLYGGGSSGTELAAALAKAKADTAVNARVELLNPTRESFADWGSDPAMMARYGGRRAIPNANLGFKSAAVNPNSGQSIQDANLIKLRITHGYELKVPLASTIMQFMMRLNDSGTDPFVSALYAQRRIPLVTHVTLQMQSDALEPGNPVSNAGLGNNGNPTDPGSPATPPSTLPTTPPLCVAVGCTVVVDPTAPPGGGGPGNTGDPPIYGCPPGDPSCAPLCTAS